MGNLPLSERIRNWIGEVAFDIFLWAVRMNADEYFEMIMSGETPNETLCSICGYPEYKHSAITHEFEPMV